MRFTILCALAVAACASDPTAAPVSANAAPAGDAAPATLEGEYAASWWFRTRDLAPVMQPNPNGGGGGPIAPSMSVAGDRLHLGVFMRGCSVRLLRQSPTLVLVATDACASVPGDGWLGPYVSARLSVRPGAMLTVGSGRIAGAIELDFTGTVDRNNPNEGVTQTGVITLTLNLVRAPSP